MATKKTAKKSAAKKTAKKTVKKAAKKKTTKKAVKKTAKKASKKKPAKKAKVKAKKPAKTAKKKASSAMKKSIKKVAKKSTKTDKRHDEEIAKLKNDVSILKKNKGKNTKRVSEYNLFMRKQIRKGLTFKQAAKQWATYKKLMDKPVRKQTAYNQFIGSQMKLGKTFTEAVKLWKLAKAGKLGKKGKTRTITKTITKRVKSKPKIKYRTRTSKPKTVTRTVTKNVGITKDQIKSLMSGMISKKDISNAMDASDEEIAFNVIETYFKELARVGFKKQLTLDEVINAYLYALARVKRDDIEMSEVSNAVKKARLKK